MGMLGFGKKPEPIDPMKFKLIVLSAATKALDYKKKNPDLNDDQVIQHIASIANRIIDEAK